MTRGMSGAYDASGSLASRPRHRLRVEHEIVPFEQARDARLVDLHLQAADAQGAVGRDAVAIGTPLSLASMPSTPSGGTALTSAAAMQSGAPGPGLARDETDAEAAGVQQQLAAFEDGAGLRASDMATGLTVRR